MGRKLAIAGALAVVACAGVSACGGDDEGTIPPDAGQQLLDQLAEVESAVNAGDCDRAQDAAVTFATSVNELPPEVDSEVRDSLIDASGNLEDLTGDPEKCIEPDTGATGETTVPPPTTDTTDTTAETTTTDTTTTEPEPDDEQGGGPPDEPPGGGNGDPGGGNGNGGGDGGGDDSSGGIGSDG